MPVLNPYLTFAGNAREAMQFYNDVFGGNLTVNTFGEYGAPEGVDPNQVMHAMLVTDSGFTLMASDTPPGTEHTPGSSVAISLSGTEGDELRGYWSKLSADGNVAMPLEKQMWGDEFGMCTDRYGIEWMVNIGQPDA